ncbi:MAG: hypothetical protein PHC84_05575 [Clostridia bacterium]|nr:hypothetical protein [Clostridia bacterium]
METSPNPVKLLAVIVEKAKGKKVVKVLNDFGLNAQVATLGAGTATLSIQSLLGFCETCKSVMLAVIPAVKSAEIMQALNEELNFEKPETGIAFTIPIKSVSGMLTLQYMLGEKKEI